MRDMRFSLRLAGSEGKTRNCFCLGKAGMEGAVTRVGGSLVVASFTSRSVLDEAGNGSSMFGLSMSIFFKWVISLEISRSDDWGWGSDGIAKSLGMLSFLEFDRASASADSSQVALGSIVSIWRFL